MDKYMIQIPLEWLSIALGNLDRGVRTFHWMNGTFLDDLRRSTVNQTPHHLDERYAVNQSP